jgi:hypothetical protein
VTDRIPNDRDRPGILALWAPDGELAITMGLGRMPARCPYQPGDWVRLHAYPGYTGTRQWGFRGIVLGGMGGGWLRGITDDGLEWGEPWGHLTRDGESNGSAMPCTCCPPPAPRVRRGQVAGQLSLLDGAG